MSEWSVAPRVFQWQNIEIIAANDISRPIGIVPIVGYLILFNDAILEHTSFERIAGTHGESVSPFFVDGITKLRLTFFGSIFVFISMLLFRGFAPLHSAIQNPISTSHKGSWIATTHWKYRKLSEM